MALTTLKIGGTTINRPASRLIMNSWTINLDRPDELEFTELGVNLPGSFHPEQTVTLTIASVVVFSGWIFSRHPSGAGSGQINIGYRCLSLKYGAYMIPITATDGTGTMPFNLPTSDPNYQAIFAGQTVGDILTTVFATNSTQLGALGISTDSTTVSQLAALTVTPPDPVYMQGPSLWAQVDNLLQQWYGSRYGVIILGSGLIRVVDTFGLTNETLVLGTDPIVLNSMVEDTSESYTQVILRGRENVRPASLSLSDTSLIDPNTTSEATWKIDDFLYPKGGYDVGNITVVTSTTLTIQSDDPTQHVAANYWSGIQAQVAAIFPIGITSNDTEYKHITANTAMVAGGTCVLTLDSALAGSSYTRYQIRGNSLGASQDYRRYNIRNTYISQHLVKFFPFAVPFSPSQFEIIQTTYPQSTISYSSGGLKLQAQVPFEIVPYDGTTNGYILFYNPVVQVNNSQANLQIGGSSVAPPTDINVFVPYSVGTLSVQSPSGGGFSGTAFSLFGVERTLYRDYPSWIDGRQTTNLQALSDAILATVNQALQEGQLTYYGQYLNALTPGSPITLSIGHFSLTTGYESMQAPCRSVTLEWPQNGAATWITRLNFSTRRQQYSGDRLYLHANYTEGPGWAALNSFKDMTLNSGLSAQLGSVGAGNALNAPSPTSNIPMGDYSMPGLGMSKQDALADSRQSKQESLAASKDAARKSPANQIEQMRERTAFEQQFGVLPGGNGNANQ